MNYSILITCSYFRNSAYYFSDLFQFIQNDVVGRFVQYRRIEDLFFMLCAHMDLETGVLKRCMSCSLLCLFEIP